MVEELIDVVNKNDFVIDTVSRSEIFEKGLVCRVVNVFIKNSLGQLWIPRRTASKKKFPSCLDMSMGGFVTSGETYEQTLKRELLEELRLNIDNTDYRLLGYINPYTHPVSSFMKVYEILSDEVPNYNPEDFSEYFWLYPNEILNLAKSGEKIKGDLVPLIELFYTSHVNE